jgi:hypothetical protein
VSREVVRVGDVWKRGVGGGSLSVAAIQNTDHQSWALDHDGDAMMAIGGDGCPLYDDWTIVSRAETERELVGEWWELRNAGGQPIATNGNAWRFKTRKEADRNRWSSDRIVHVRRHKVRRAKGG